MHRPIFSVFGFVMYYILWLTEISYMTKYIQKHQSNSKLIFYAQAQEVENVYKWNISKYGVAIIGTRW